MHLLIGLVIIFQFATCFSENIPIYRPEATHQLHFCVTRNLTDGALKASVIEQLKTAFNLEAFVETGTWMGDTAEEASEFFDEIHTIELSPEICAQAVERFKECDCVRVYQGDSGKILADILSSVRARTLFYLDGHYSGGVTAKGDTCTPILEEINQIRISGKSDSVILIDDIRLFQNSIYPEKIAKFALEEYPDIADVVHALLQINPAYQICFLGDALLAFPDDPKISVSPVVRACALHRLASVYDVSDDVLNQADMTIACASGEEQEELDLYYQVYSPFELEYGYRSYAAFWFALIQRAKGLEAEAQMLFQQAAQNSQLDWRVERFIQ